MRPVDFSLYKFQNLPPLNGEEEKSPYAGFYYEPVRDPEPEVAAGLGTEQMDVSLALPAEDLKLTVDPDRPVGPSGWCILPDGTSYSRVVTNAPGVTLEMNRWFWRWSMEPDYDFLHYRIWLPGLHWIHIPITEDLGWGMTEMETVAGIRPEMIGLTVPPSQIDPRIISFNCVSGCARPLYDPDEEGYYIVLCHCFRKMPEGMQILTQAYHGIAWQDGAFRKVHDAVPERVRVFAMHNAWEFRRMADIVPKLYAVSGTEQL